MAKLKIPPSLADHCRMLVNIAPSARMDSNEVIKVNIVYTLFLISVAQAIIDQYVKTATMEVSYNSSDITYLLIHLHSFFL